MSKLEIYSFFAMILMFANVLGMALTSNTCDHAPTMGFYIFIISLVISVVTYVMIADECIRRKQAEVRQRKFSKRVRKDNFIRKQRRHNNG